MNARFFDPDSSWSPANAIFDVGEVIPFVDPQCKYGVSYVLYVSADQLVLLDPFRALAAAKVFRYIGMIHQTVVFSCGTYDRLHDALRGKAKIPKLCV